jgi:hypothetical protein
MEIPMRKVILIVAAALSLVAAMPLVAAWWVSAEQHAMDLPIQQIQGLWVVY